MTISVRGITYEPEPKDKNFGDQRQYRDPVVVGLLVWHNCAVSTAAIPAKHTSHCNCAVSTAPHQILRKAPLNKAPSNYKSVNSTGYGQVKQIKKK